MTEAVRTVCVNGETINLAAPTTLAELIVRQNVRGKRYAVEVDNEIIPRSEHDAFVLRGGEQVEIVQAIGGG